MSGHFLIMKKTIFFIFLFLISCKNADKNIHKSNNLSEKDILHIIVVDYYKEALHFEYEDETGEWYDASKVKLINSKIYTNIFYIYHSIPVDNDSIWRTKNNVIKCKSTDNLINLIKKNKDIFISDINILTNN